jgi:hypothetical protein
MVESKSTCPKWHFGQVGHGGKKTIWEVFLTKIPSKKKLGFLVVFRKQLKLLNMSFYCLKSLVIVFY